jgi:hypothetical protein
MRISKIQFNHYIITYLILITWYLICCIIFIPYLILGGFINIILYIGSAYAFYKYYFNLSFKLGLSATILYFLPYSLAFLFVFYISSIAYIYLIFLPISIISWVGAIIFLVILKKYLELEPNLKEEHEIERKVRTMDFETRKNRLLGMIRIDKFLDLEKAQLFLGMSKYDVKALIYDLAGEKKLEGEFKDNKFIITSNIDDFLLELELSFINWQEKTALSYTKVK